MVSNGLFEVVSYDKSIQIEKVVAIMAAHGDKIRQPKAKTEPSPKTKVKTVNDKTVNGEPEVNVSGIFYEAGGYGKVNRYLASNLAAEGLKVKVSPKKGHVHLTASELATVARLERTELSRKHITIDSVIPTFSEFSGGRYKIIYTTVEAYTVPKQFIDACRQYDEVWVTSPFAKSVIQPSLDRDVKIVPTGIDPEIYNEDVRPVQFKPPLKDFVFVSVFGWSYRKGYDVLLRSYFREFSSRDPVSLLLYTRYMQGTADFHKQKIEKDIAAIAKSVGKSDIPHYRVVSKVLDENQMAQLYRSCHAFVLPTRGESTCLPLAEASLCGLPVIMTNASGQTLFLQKDNSFLLDVDSFEVVQPGQLHVHYWDGQKFPSLKSKRCIEQLSSLMRSVYEDYDAAKEKNRRLQELLLGSFTWKQAGQTAATRLREIWTKL